jgi:hypothetical protein
MRLRRHALALASSISADLSDRRCQAHSPQQQLAFPRKKCGDGSLPPDPGISTTRPRPYPSR